MTYSSIARLFVALCLVSLYLGCQSQPPRESAHQALASTSAALPGQLVNRIGVPTSGAGATGSADSDDESGEDEKDYWANIDFDRSNFEETRSYVRERYIESDIDDSRAYAQAAEFVLASNEKDVMLLVPEAFYLRRKGDPKEEGRFDGKRHKLSEDDKFVLLEAVDDKDSERKQLSDDEIRELRVDDRNRRAELERDWKAGGFSRSDFDRVMRYAINVRGPKADWDAKKAWVAATQGYLYSLDPHSSLISAEAWEDSTREITDSSFEGIGAILTRRPDSEYTIVESPLEGQPALKAGLRAGDVILEVNGESIKGEILPKVVNRIRGKKGTKVTLKVERIGQPKPLLIGIVRSKIEMKNIQYKLVPGRGAIGHIRVNGFVPTTHAKLVDAFIALQAQAKGKLSGLVLDLRRNSGGLLQQGIDVANQFLERGRIVTVKNRGEADEHYDADDKGTWSIPLVVLVDDGSASASEIVASALQDNRRALVLGDRTFGKASVQTLFRPLLRDDYYIKLTVARYYSPNDRSLQVVGVRPDIEVAPEFDGKMPLGFREEDLSNHLSAMETAYVSANAADAKRVSACIEAKGKAKGIAKNDPNPAVKLDYQLHVAADALECLSLE